MKQYLAVCVFQSEDERMAGHPVDRDGHPTSVTCRVHTFAELSRRAVPNGHSELQPEDVLRQRRMAGGRSSIPVRPSRPPPMIMPLPSAETPRRLSNLEAPISIVFSYGRLPAASSIRTIPFTESLAISFPPASTSRT